MAINISEKHFITKTATSSSPTGLDSLRRFMVFQISGLDVGCNVKVSDVWNKEERFYICEFFRSVSKCFAKGPATSQCLKKIVPSTSICKELTLFLKTTHIPMILIKGKVGPQHTYEDAGGEIYSSYSFTTSALGGREWSASRPGRALAPEKGPPVPIVQEAGWAPEPVWTQRIEEKFFRLCRKSNLDRPVVQSVARHYTD
jgi:hypothetical protein